MKEISGFAAILQAPETSSKLACRLCTAEVRGSNPLGSTEKTGVLQENLGPKMSARLLAASLCSNANLNKYTLATVGLVMHL
jgi:hypothetical protein